MPAFGPGTTLIHATIRLALHKSGASRATGILYIVTSLGPLRFVRIKNGLNCAPRAFRLLVDVC